MHGVNGWTVKVAGWLAGEAGDEFWARRADELEVELAAEQNEFDGYGERDEVECVVSALADEMREFVHRCFRVPYARLRGVDFLAIAREYVREYA